jgi:hypothetical protein
MSGYAAYYEYYMQYMKKYPQQRPGQAAFNAACFFSPQTKRLAEAITATSYDPFHNGHQIRNFLEYLRIGIEAEGELIVSLSNSSMRLDRLQLWIKDLQRRLVVNDTLTDPERGAYRYVIENIIKIIEEPNVSDKEADKLTPEDEARIRAASKKATDREIDWEKKKEREN